MEVCGDAADEDEGLERVATARPDLVVVDISLKHGNGLDLIKRLKASHPNVKVLVSSMHDESLFAERALHAGALGYINKQDSPEKVIEAIRKVLDGQVYLSAEMTNHLLHRLGNRQHDSLERPSVDTLSDREWEVFELIGQGLSTRQIAERLHRSIKTIETHREHIKEKLGLANGTELTRHAVQWVLESH
jgi:DNA-binding NarL/FixJ family response regulator